MTSASVLPMSSASVLPTASGSVRTALLAAVLLVAVVLCASAADDAPEPYRPPWEREPPPEPDFPDVSVTVEWLGSRLGDRDVVVVDARSPDAYSSGHIPGAIQAPEDLESVPGDLPDVLGGMGLTGRERIVCYGDDSRSGPACRMFWLLEFAGASRVFLLEGGVEAWLESGRALTRETSARPAAAWTAAVNAEVMATREYVRRSFGEEGHEILDARGREAWDGPVDSSEWGSRPRVGHIPHALPLDWWEFFDADGSLKSPSDGWATFVKIGPRPANPVDVTWEFIVYGDGVSGDGARGYFLLRRAGVSSVRYFPGGWAEWSGDPYLPVVRIVSAEEIRWRLRKARRWLKPGAPPETFAFFDVRHPADHARGHIAGSVTLRSDYFADSLDVRLEQYWPDIDRASAPVVTYCYGERCIRSRATSTAAAREGFIYIDRLYGGLDEWRYIGESLVRD